MEGRSSVELSLALTKHLELKRQLRRVFIEMLALSETHERAAYERALVAFQEDEIDHFTQLEDPKLIHLLALPRPDCATHLNVALSDHPMSPSSKRNFTITAHQHPERMNGDPMRVKSEPSALLTKKYTPPLRAPPKLSVSGEAQPQRTISHTVTKKNEDIVAKGSDSEDDARMETAIGNSVEIVELVVEKANEEERPSVVKILEVSVAIVPSPLPSCVEIAESIVDKANAEVQGAVSEGDLTDVHTTSMSCPNEADSLSIAETTDEMLVKEVNDGMEEDTQMVEAHVESKGSIGSHIETATEEDVPSMFATQNHDTIREAVMVSLAQQTMGSNDSPKSFQDESDTESSADANSQLTQEEKPIQNSFADFAIEVYKVSLEDTLIEPSILAEASTIHHRDVDVPLGSDTMIRDDTVIEPTPVVEASPLVVNDHCDNVKVSVVTTSNESTCDAEVSPFLINGDCDVEVSPVTANNEVQLSESNADQDSPLVSVVNDHFEVPVVMECNESNADQDSPLVSVVNDHFEVPVVMECNESTTGDGVSPLVDNVNGPCEVQVPDVIESNADPFVESTFVDEAYTLVGTVNDQCDFEVPVVIESKNRPVVIENNIEPVADAVTSDEVSQFVSTKNDLSEIQVPVVIETTGVNEEPLVIESADGSHCDVEATTITPETTGTTVINEHPVVESSPPPAESSVLTCEGTALPQIEAIDNGNTFIASNSIGDKASPPSVSTHYDADDHPSTEPTMNEEVAPVVSMVNDRSDVEEKKDVGQPSDEPHCRSAGVSSTFGDGKQETNDEGENVSTNRVGSICTSSPVKPPVSVSIPKIMIDTSSPEQVDRDWKKKFKASLQNMPVFGSAPMAPPGLYTSFGYGSSTAHSQAREHAAQEFMSQSSSIVGAANNKTSVAAAQQDVVSELTRALRQRIKADDDFL